MDGATLAAEAMKAEVTANNEAKLNGEWASVSGVIFQRRHGDRAGISPRIAWIVLMEEYCWLFQLRRTYV